MCVAAPARPASAAATRSGNVHGIGAVETAGDTACVAVVLSPNLQTESMIMPVADFVTSCFEQASYFAAEI